MSRWSDQFENNEIHQTLKQLSDALEVEPRDIDAEHESEKRRLKKSLQTITEIIGGFDPEFVPEHLIIQLNQQLRQTALFGNLQAYSANPSVQLLREANDHLTTIVPIVAQLAALSRQPKARDIIRSLEEAVDAFNARLEQREKEFAGRLGPVDIRDSPFG